VVPELRASQPKIQAFRAWLLEEVAAATAAPRSIRASSKLAAE
jgi:hypothetical protein